MKSPHYTVKAEISESVSTSRITYMLREHSTAWAGDCSSSYGTGSYEASTKIIDTSEDLVFIQDLCDTLNKYTGETK